MTKTQDQVTMRARTKIQARGELKVEYRSSVKVFFRADAEPASAVLLSMTMVVVVDVRAEEWSLRECGQGPRVLHDQEVRVATGVKPRTRVIHSLYHHDNMWDQQDAVGRKS